MIIFKRFAFSLISSVITGATEAYMSRRCLPFHLRYIIGLYEVESCLLEHPAVAESAVVSSPDALYGEVVKAFVVLAEDYKHEDANTLITDLQDHVKSLTAPFKCPRKVINDKPCKYIDL